MVSDTSKLLLLRLNSSRNIILNVFNLARTSSGKTVKLRTDRKGSKTDLNIPHTVYVAKKLVFELLFIEHCIVLDKFCFYFSEMDRSLKNQCTFHEASKVKARSYHTKADKTPRSYYKNKIYLL